MASERCGSPHGAHAATTRRHGARVGRAPKQEHCGRSWHQSAYGREPPRLDHEEDRVEVVARVGEIGVSCLGWRRRAATGALRLRLLGRSLWRPAPSRFASVHLIDAFFGKLSWTPLKPAAQPKRRVEGLAAAAKQRIVSPPAATRNAIRRSTMSTPCWRNAYPQPSTFVGELAAMTGAPAALVAAIVLQFVWIGIGLATNWDPYPFVFLLTCSNVIQLILIFVIAVAQRQLSLHDELRAEADHGAISRLLYHQEAQELLLVRLAEKLDVDARDLRPILSTLAGKAARPPA